MAYQGGTTLITPRLKAAHLDWMAAYCKNKNRFINDALSAFLRKYQLERLNPSTVHLVTLPGRDKTELFPTHREKTSVRILRQNIEFVRLNCLNLTRCLDYALEDAIHAHPQETQRNYDATTDNQ